MRRVAAFVVLLAGCAVPRGHWVDARNVVRAPSRWPAPAVVRATSKPRIEALWMNETTIRTGGVWRGQIVTSTNVTSVEVRTESFTFNAQRQSPGVFTFSQNVLDMVPQYRRGYTLHVIARNARDASDVWLVPISMA